MTLNELAVKSVCFAEAERNGDGQGRLKKAFSAGAFRSSDTATTAADSTSDWDGFSQCTSEDFDESQQALLAAVEQSAHALTLSDPRDPDGALLMVSRGFEEMTGWPKEALVGTSGRALDAGCYNDLEDLMRLRLAQQDGTPTSAVLTRRRASEELFKNMVHLRGFTAGSDPFTGEKVWLLLGIHFDVTEEEGGGGLGAASDQEEAVRRAVSELEHVLAGEAEGPATVEQAGPLRSPPAPAPDSTSACGEGAKVWRLLGPCVPAAEADPASAVGAADEQSPRSSAGHPVPRWAGVEFLSGRATRGPWALQRAWPLTRFTLA